MRRVLAWIAAVLAVLALVGLGGAGWYYSGLVIDPSHEGSYPLEVVAFDGSKVTLKGGSDTAAPGTYGLTWRDGNATLGPVVSVAGSTVVREVTRVRRGTLAPGVHACLMVALPTGLRWLRGAAALRPCSLLRPSTAGSGVTRTRARRSACRTRGCRSAAS
ncbi:hypothetical protein ACIHFD_43825 [Nonomuraea sp. NPDC051941]|uniref:hypothetical protein n=1 Tax=Nonomuraea sp. NPDC051941 TaxID=3364373 RepID=UPI0037C80F5C